MHRMEATLKGVPSFVPGTYQRVASPSQRQPRCRDTTGRKLDVFGLSSFHAVHSKSGDRKVMGVRFPPPALIYLEELRGLRGGISQMASLLIVRCA